MPQLLCLNNRPNLIRLAAYKACRQLLGLLMLSCFFLGPPHVRDLLASIIGKVELIERVPPVSRPRDLPAPLAGGVAGLVAGVVGVARRHLACGARADSGRGVEVRVDGI